MSTRYKHFVFVILCFSALSQTASAGSTETDSLRHIFSFWHEDYWVRDQAYNYNDFVCTASGDTALSAMITRTNTVFDDLDTFVIRVRIWESTTGNYVSSSRYIAIQPTGSSRPQFQLALMRGRPRLFYAPTPETLLLVDILSETVLQRYECNDDILGLNVSPDASFCFINVGMRSYRVYNNETGELLLNDNTIYRGNLPVNQYVTDKMTTVNSLSWSLDNSILMLRLNEVAVRKPDQTSDYYNQIYRPFYLATKTYGSSFFRQDRHGRWTAEAKRFITYNTSRFYMTSLDGNIDSTTIAMDMGCRDFYYVQGTARILMLGYDGTISVRDMLTGQKYIQFVPGNVIGACASEDGSLFAYVTDDNVLRILNTITLQGVFTETLTAPHNILLGDEGSFAFLRGNRVLRIRDQKKRLHFYDIPARSYLTQIDESQEWYMSSDGNNLFVLDSVFHRYDCFTGERISQFPNNEFLHRINVFALSPSGEQIVVADSTHLQRWDLRSQRMIVHATYPLITELLWSPDSNLVVLQQADTARKLFGYTIVNASNLVKRYAFAADSNLNFLAFAPSLKYLYFSHADSLLGYNTTTSRIELIRLFSAHPTAIALKHNATPSDTCYVGTKKGDVWEQVFGGTYARPLLMRWSEIVRLHVNKAATTLCVSTRDSMIVLRLRDKEHLGRLVTMTRAEQFIGSDSLCVGVYQDAIVEFQIQGGKPTKYETGTQPYLRPTGDYYATIGRRPHQSLQLFRYGQPQDTRMIEATASHKSLQWSANSAAVAALDLYNNIVVWRPAGLKEPDTVTVDVEDESVAMQSLELAPNPATDGVRLYDTSSDAREQGKGAAQLSVYNELGQNCLSKSINASHEWLDLRSLPSGMYIISIQQGSQVRTARLIVQR